MLLIEQALDGIIYRHDMIQPFQRSLEFSPFKIGEVKWPDVIKLVSG